MASPRGRADHTRPLPSVAPPRSFVTVAPPAICPSHISLIASLDDPTFEFDRLQGHCAFS